MRHPPRSTLFPSTPLSRSLQPAVPTARTTARSTSHAGALRLSVLGLASALALSACNESQDKPRSEEHTSELQSRLHLVCRLLLEKKNNSASAQLLLTSHRS